MSCERTDGRDRHLGGSVHPRHRRLLEIACRPADQRRRHRGAAADEHLEVGQPGVRALGRGRAVPSRNGVAPAMWVQRVREHQRRPRRRRPSAPSAPPWCPAAAGIRRRRSIRRCARSATGTRNVSPSVDQPVLADLTDQRVDRIVACAERLSAVRWCPTCRGSSARRRGPAPAAAAVRLALEQRRRTACGAPASPRTHHDLRRRGHARRSPGSASSRSRAPERRWARR